MSKKDKRFMRMNYNKNADTFTLMMTRRNCSDCGSSNLVSADKKLARHYLKELPERQESLNELVQVTGASEFWVCQDCKAFGNIPIFW